MPVGKLSIGVGAMVLFKKHKAHNLRKNFCLYSTMSECSCPSIYVPFLRSMTLYIGTCISKGEVSTLVKCVCGIAFYSTLFHGIRSVFCTKIGWSWLH